MLQKKDKKQKTEEKITEITLKKLKKYFSITSKALEMAKKAINKERNSEAIEILDMSQRYYDDAHWFENKKDYVNAFACLNYAHGWLDSGSRLGIFDVKDSKIFVIK
jgi:hypothetical protein